MAQNFSDTKRKLLPANFFRDEEKNFFRDKGKTETFSNEENIREFVASKKL